MNSQNLSPTQANGDHAARKPRADGLETRKAILLAAANLATTRGLDVLSIGELAEHIGMSKSGLYAHFKSKEELELATIETAAEIFAHDVIEPVPESLKGVARLMALAESFLQHLHKRVFPGGCFFAAVSAQLAAQPSRARDRVLQIQQHWAGKIAEALHQARDAGEIRRDADVDQLIFEISAMLLRANLDWVVTDDQRVLERARIGVRHVLKRVADQTKPNRKSQRRA
jgi:AcrR family transcriptional regulator